MFKVLHIEISENSAKAIVKCSEGMCFCRFYPFFFKHLLYVVNDVTQTLVLYLDSQPTGEQLSVISSC